MGAGRTLPADVVVFGIVTKRVKSSRWAILGGIFRFQVDLLGEQNMTDSVYGIPLYIILPLILVLLVILVYLVMKAVNEGREVSFWPPKIGPRPNPDNTSNKEITSDHNNENGKGTSIQDNLDPDFVDQTIPALYINTDPIGMLRVISGRLAGTCLFVTHEHRTLTFGRGKECDVVFPDIVFSRTHFRINIEPIDANKGSARNYEVELIDTGSANGTFVNGKRVSHIKIRDFDLIEVGGTTIRYYALSR